VTEAASTSRVPLTTKEARALAVLLLGEDAVAFRLPRRPVMQRCFMGSRAKGRGVFGPTFESCANYLRKHRKKAAIESREG
jgi:hypothetical protein